MSQLKITARDLIRRSLILVGAIGQGENPTNQEANDGLLTLNEIVDKWNNESLMISYTKNIEVPLVANKQLYTIGELGDILELRPTSGIQGAYFQMNSTSLPVKMLSSDQYDGIILKDTNSNIVNYIYYNAVYPLGELYVWPTSGQGKLVLTVAGQFEIFQDLDTIIDLPSGYIKALRYNLAVELAPEYGKSMDQQVVELAVGAKNYIKSTNSAQKVRYMSTDAALMTSRGGFNIYTGD